MTTLISPIGSLVLFISVALLTQKKAKPKYEAINYRPTDQELISGA